MRLYDQNHLRNLNPPRDLVGSFFMKGATCVYPVGGLFLSLVAIEQKRNLQVSDRFFEFEALLTTGWASSSGSPGRIGSAHWPVNRRTNGVESHTSDSIRVTKIADALIPEELPPIVFAPGGAENRAV